MPISLLSSMETQISRSSSQYWALCFRITLTTIANRVYRFTDHPEPLTFPGGEVFESMDGMEGSAQQRRDEFKGINRDFRGLIADSSISDEDLNRGIFQGAYIEEYLVDTRLAGIGPINVTQYWVRAMSFDGGIWRTEVDGTTSQFDQPVGDFWGKVCRVAVFSQGLGKCNVSPTAFRNTAPIQVVNSDHFEFEFDNALPVWDELRFGNDGWCTFVTGLNIGFTARIKSYFIAPPAPPATVKLHVRTPYPMAVNDIVELLPGCNNRIGPTGHCQTRYSNIENFQGEPFIPGGDKARRGASLR